MSATEIDEEEKKEKEARQIDATICVKIIALLFPLFLCSLLIFWLFASVDNAMSQEGFDNSEPSCPSSGSGDISQHNMEYKKTRRYLPKTFFRLITLQSGLELILLYTAINKMSGVFGLLSLFTNHKINFMQWTYYVLNTLVLIITVLCYLHIKKLTTASLANISLNTDSNLTTIKVLAFFVLVYIVDFFIGNLFMVYLTKMWFVEEYASSQSAATSTTAGTKPAQLIKRVSNVLSEQSASELYEVFVSVVTVFVSEVLRIYFISIALSYYLRLRRRISRPCSGFGAYFVDFLDKLN